MKDPFRQSLVVSTVIHALVIVAVIGLSFMSGCFRRHPKELVTFIDLQVALPPPPAVESVPDIRPPPPAPKRSPSRAPPRRLAAETLAPACKSPKARASRSGSTPPAAAGWA